MGIAGLLEIVRCPQHGQRFFLEKPEYRRECMQSEWFASREDARVKIMEAKR